ncbi:ABC transporter ATP-binding protein [Actinoplanes xinjiangensis]|jgi:ABC-2 type transport system ATP-binding protein|uniref:ABC-2 type transport system ATP-binding protein n=1 Tax=Actinoplanes xinjiangensis TaxID=512350 RepID=A0A316EKE3_9ACTN|nr:ABC transporter ATP-binding protein [Actinoplanes xinjiangensis]PWK31740.1 ABC-2 type transport system ATP-binding protein [Actinoplanes xinjiangensis]GIF43885.1 ABC transporter [Actinoplanes xinjiangensis]
MTSDLAVLTEDLTKFYGDHRGVEGLNLEVGTGEVMGFLGPNGAGKTTTIRLLLDFLRPSRGRTAVLGLDPRRDKAALHRQIGYLPGELAFPGRDTAEDLLRFFGDARGGVAWSKVTDLAGRLEVDLSRPVRTMSKGNKQKVGLIQAFMHEPALLILDEPTSGLDPLMQQEFLAMVRDARSAGQTVFMSSHVLAEVQHVADRVAIVRDGRLVAVERVESLGRRAVRAVEIHFHDPVDPADFTDLPGVSDVVVSGPVLTCTVDGRLDPLIKAAARYEVVDLLSAEPDLEETFLSFYYHSEGAGDAHRTRA